MPLPNRGEFDDEEITLNVQRTDKYPFLTRVPLRPKLLFQHFEKPSLVRITILTVLCVVAYPVLFIVTLVARDLPLFTVRVFVAVGCSGVGFSLSYSLLWIGVRHIEAAALVICRLRLGLKAPALAWPEPALAF